MEKKKKYYFFYFWKKICFYEKKRNIADILVANYGEGEEDDTGGQVSQDGEEQRVDAGGEDAVQEHHVDAKHDLHSKVTGDDDEFLHEATSSHADSSVATTIN